MCIYTSSVDLLVNKSNFVITFKKLNIKLHIIDFSRIGLTVIGIPEKIKNLIRFTLKFVLNKYNFN